MKRPAPSLAAFAAVAVLITGCRKEDTINTDTAATETAINLAAAGEATRAASAGTTSRVAADSAGKTPEVVPGSNGVGTAPAASGTNRSSPATPPDRR